MSRHRSAVGFADLATVNGPGGARRRLLLVGAGRAVHASCLARGAPWNQRLGGASRGTARAACATADGAKLAVLHADGAVAVFARERDGDFAASGVCFGGSRASPPPSWLFATVPAACAAVGADAVVVSTRAHGLALVDLRAPKAGGPAGALAESRPGHDGPIAGIALDGGGRALSGGWDGLAVLWRVSREGVRAVARYRHRSASGGKPRVGAVALLADRAVTGADDQRVRVFDVAAAWPVVVLEPDAHDYCGLASIRCLHLTAEGVLYAGDTVGNVLVSGGAAAKSRASEKAGALRESPRGWRWPGARS